MQCTGWQEEVARILRSLRSGRREMKRLCEVDDSDEDASEDDDDEVVAPWPSPHRPFLTLRRPCAERSCHPCPQGIVDGNDEDVSEGEEDDDEVGGGSRHLIHGNPTLNLSLAALALAFNLSLRLSLSLDRSLSLDLNLNLSLTLTLTLTGTLTLLPALTGE